MAGKENRKSIGADRETGACLKAGTEESVQREKSKRKNMKQVDRSKKIRLCFPILEKLKGLFSFKKSFF